MGEQCMATKKSVTLDGVEYVRADSVKATPPQGSSIRIVILQRGWVMIGYYTESGDNCVLDNAHVIRRWGTTNGLGELANEGKKTNTKLEPTGHVEFHKLTVVATINCNEALWKDEL